MPNATNIAFTLCFKINNKNREFNFRKRTELLFDVDTAGSNDRIMFQMSRDEKDHTWQIIGRELPEWLLNNATLIADALTNELAAK